MLYFNDGSVQIKLLIYGLINKMHVEALGLTGMPTPFYEH